MTDDELRAISANWSSYPTVGLMQDGAEIKNIGADPKRPNFNVREPSGYFCTPLAYSVRLDDNASGRKWFTPKWCVAD